MIEREKSAFPYEWKHSPNGPEGQMGMSLRDYFAGQALSSMYDGEGLFSQRNPTAVAQRCYKVADAMMEEREKQTEVEEYA